MRAGWAGVKLGEVCELKYGKSLKDADRSGAGFPVYGSNGIVGYHRQTLTAGPAIVVGRKGSYGEINVSATSCWPIDTTYYVDRTCTAADLGWLGYRIASLGLNTMNRAAAVPGLNREDAYRQEFLLPPIEEQRRIAAILDKADELRAQRRAALAQLDTLTEAIFIDMFGDPLTWHQYPPTGTTAETTLGALASITTGKLDANAADADGQYPFFTCSRETLRINKAAFDGKAILVAGNGDLNVKYYEGKFNAYQRTYVIKSRDESKADPKFLHGFLNIYVSRLREQAIGGVIKYIKLPYLTDAVVRLPDISTQGRFVGLSESTERMQQQSGLAGRAVETVFSALQQRAFSGAL